MVTADVLIDKLKEYAGEDYKESQLPFIKNLVDNAISEVVRARYPYGFSANKADKITSAVIDTYAVNIQRIAEYHYDKQGKEGVERYSENNTTMVYESSGTPKSLLRNIVPVSRIV